MALGAEDLPVNKMDRVLAMMVFTFSLGKIGGIQVNKTSLEGIN